MFRGKKRFYVLLIILSAFAFWASNGCKPTPKPEKLDHFKVYQVDSLGFDLPVLLKGQFDNNEIKASLTALTHFANPTSKFHRGSKTKIKNPDGHLNWYALRQEQPEPRRTIRFENQFGKHSVVIKDPKYLLVPTQKTSHKGSKFPKSLDHYKCYEVIDINSMPNLPTVTLEDQFGREDSVRVRKPIYFCVPVSKNRPGVPPDGKIMNEKDHLAIYAIPPSPHQRQIKVKDQFEELKLRVTRSVMLAIPSEKEEPPTTDPDSLDHFKVYEVDSVGFDLPVLLKGQFDDNEIKARLTALTHFANPTSKFQRDSTTKIKNLDAHLNWYKLFQEQPEPRRTIRFKNQFGQHSVDIKDPRYLLVPAQKTSHEGREFPDSLDHYKCYEVIAINTAPNLPVVTLEDQFGREDSVRVRKPIYFCVPVSKNLPGAEPIGRIVNEKDHLVIYEIPPKPSGQQIATRDQFEELQLLVTQSVMLAVPTEKQVVVPHDN